MDVYKFDKSLLERMDELLYIFNWKGELVPSSRVKDEWAYYIEVQIEPTGWQAVWKIPKAICEGMKIKYPTFVFGMVQQVLFKELKAIFQIIAVQDEDVQLPEEQEVQLTDLWVTIEQENNQMNIEKTAELLDSFRFFYNIIWMPWDCEADDNIDWSDKNLESRIRFYYDIKNKLIKKSTINYINKLLIEARYLQNRREYLELELSDDETDEAEVLEKNQIKDLMRIQYRLSMIRNTIEILENPVMREIYEDCEQKDNLQKYDQNDTKKVEVFIVGQPCTLTEQIKLLNQAKVFIDSDKIVKMFSKLQDALNSCSINNTILILPGTYDIKFLEYLNGNNTMIGICPTERNESVQIISNNDESILLTFDGDYKLKNITLDCENMNTGVYIKNSSVTFENCKIIGSKNLANTHGIILLGTAKLILKNCLIENFSTGVVLNNVSKLILNDSKIQSCGIGIQLNFEAEVEFNNAELSNCKDFAIKWETKNTQKRKIYEDLKMTESLNPPWKGNCLFKDNKKGNILLMNNDNQELHSIIMKSNNSNCLEDLLNDCIDI